MERKDTQRPLHFVTGFCDLVQGKPPKPPKAKAARVEMEKRSKVYKVRLSDTELEKLREGNVTNIGRFLRESALAALDGGEQKKDQKQLYTKLDRDFVLELSRIGNNVNQIAKAVHTDAARGDPFDSVRLLHLLICIDESLQALREELK